jgi:hypothetical protein
VGGVGVDPLDEEAGQFGELGGVCGGELDVGGGSSGAALARHEPGTTLPAACARFRGDAFPRLAWPAARLISSPGNEYPCSGAGRAIRGRWDT